MQWTGLNELREKFLSFFESKNHTRMESASLVPQGDKSLLLINSGMAPLKKYFLGQSTPPNTKLTTCQKCIRTPDIERVGKTARHGTYFEMLGNFSFGDYFKVEAIEWAWEFFTKTLELPIDKLYVSVYLEDDEAYDIWTKHIGVEESHMVRLGKEDNFWEHGSGPCGPCSEIYFDRGDEKGCGSPDCKVGCECDRFVEVWNLVFSQFDSDGNGNYAEMENKNIDTGMGLERLACVMQGVDNLFEVDTVRNIMNHICKIANVEYKKDDKTDVSLRVITDHIRSTSFMVADGVIPSNEGRGYVLRRLLRRAARHGRMLGITKSFLFEVCDTVIKENASAYPELEEKRAYIQKIISVEEESFAKTIDKGTELLNSFITQIIADDNSKILAGDDAFKLSDTYGFPIDLTMEICEEKGIEVDTERFAALVKEQREKARADHLAKANSSWADNSIKIESPATIFTGYESFEETDAKIVAIYNAGEEVETATEGDNVVIVLDKTPFYAESGGQAGDTGSISTSDSVISVEDTIKIENHFLHIAVVEQGNISKGETVNASLNKEKRLATMRNHTVAHLLQSALRTVLGEHVHQAGQLVNEKSCRFDFSHFSALTEDEINKVEEIVNADILNAYEVTMEEMSIEDAKKLGAMALFGEKYGNTVRVVTAHNSIEFCGGTHVSNTSNIGLFKIVSEISVASGVRRIEAVTGEGVLKLIAGYKNSILKSAKALKLANVTELPEKCAMIFNESKEKDKKIESLNQQIANTQISGIFENAEQVNGVKVISAMFKDVTNEMLRKIGDVVKSKNEESVIAVLASVSDDKGSLYCVCTPEAIKKGAHAGKIVQRISAITGGKGGGRPDNAMAGVGKTYMVDEALIALNDIVKEFIA